VGRVRTVQTHWKPRRLTAPSATLTCRVCKKQYDPATNGPASCRFHDDVYAGRLNRELTTDTSSLEYFWHCCEAGDRDATPCASGWHASYDD
jgi:hypothetical protein